MPVGVTQTTMDIFFKSLYLFVIAQCGRGEIGIRKGLKSNRSINRVTPTTLDTCSNSITCLTFNPSHLFFDGLTVASRAIVVPENDK